jgi:hypothetical protein
MLVNVANSTNPTLMKSFLETYCLPQFYSVDILPNEIANQSPGVVSQFVLDDLHSSFVLYLFQLELIPDCSVLLKESSIKQFRDDPDRSELSISVEFMGTKAFDFYLPESEGEFAAGSSSALQKNQLYTIAEELNEFLNVLRYLPSSIEEPQLDDECSSNKISCLTFPSAWKRKCRRPFTMKCEVRFRIVLDSSNKFCSLESSYPQ